MKKPSRNAEAMLSINCNPAFPEAIGRPSETVCFVIMTALRRRYRLGVRTEDSQSVESMSDCSVFNGLALGEVR